MQHLQEVTNILADVLSLGERKNSLKADSVLLGNIPELDSMAVVNVITALEDHFGITMPDDDANIDTLGELALLVDKVRAAKTA